MEVNKCKCGSIPKIEIYFGDKESPDGTYLGQELYVIACGIEEFGLVDSVLNYVDGTICRIICCECEEGIGKYKRSVKDAITSWNKGELI
jgi:hypothetical protein